VRQSPTGHTHGQAGLGDRPGDNPAEWGTVPLNKPALLENSNEPDHECDGLRQPALCGARCRVRETIRDPSRRRQHCAGSAREFLVSARMHRGCSVTRGGLWRWHVINALLHGFLRLQLHLLRGKWKERHCSRSMDHQARTLHRSRSTGIYWLSVTLHRSAADCSGPPLCPLPGTAHMVYVDQDTSSWPLFAGSILSRRRLPESVSAAVDRGDNGRHRLA